MKYILISVILIFSSLACSKDKTVVKKDVNKLTIVEDTNPNKPLALTKNINGMDLKSLASIVVKKILATDFKFGKAQNPSFQMLKIRNTSSEYLSTSLVSSDIERELINSNKVSLVASKNESYMLKQEKDSADEVKEAGNEVKADLLMKSEFINGKIKNQYFYNVEILSKENKSALKFQVLIDKNTNTVILVK